jgi:Fur family ferric uptake transcriptional regulator
VYNTLNELAAMGELLEVVVMDGPRRYDPNIGDEHDHLVCDNCHAIRDVPRSPKPSMIPEGSRAGFVVTGVEITYRGMCPQCAQRRHGNR